QSLHRGRDRGYRLNPRRDAGRTDPRPPRELCDTVRPTGPRYPLQGRQRVEGRVLLFRADPHPRVQAHRPSRPIRAGAHVMAQLPERPSAWGGLSTILDTRAKQWTAIGVLLAVMVIMPFVVDGYVTVIVTHALLY